MSQLVKTFLSWLGIESTGSENQEENAAFERQILIVAGLLTSDCQTNEEKQEKSTKEQTS